MVHPLRSQKKELVVFLHPMLRLSGTKGTLVTNTCDLEIEQPHGNGNVNNNGFFGIVIGGNSRTLCKQGQFKEALGISHATAHRGIRPSASTYASLFQGCASKKALPEGKLVHAHMIEIAFETDTFLANSLLTMYSKCGSLVDARRVLDEMPNRNVVSWTVMISAYARYRFCEEALALYCEMQRTGIVPDHFTFATVLSACANLADLEIGKEVHEGILRCGLQPDIYVGSALVDMYVKCGSIVYARQVFDKMSQRNVVSWTALIGGYIQDGHVDEALKLFTEMPERDVVTWNAMIAAFSRHGRNAEALTLFYQMQQAGIPSNQFTFASVLPACANLAALEHGKEIHRGIIRNGFQSDVFIGSALVNMYVKCGSIEVSRRVFDKMPERNVVSWNAMIGGYAQNGHVDEALKLFQNMPERDGVSWTAIIAGFALSGHIHEAQKLFQRMPERDMVSWNAMIAGYVQNGQADDAVQLFQKMPERNVVSWNSIITGYAQTGHVREALKLFQKMPERDIVSWNAMIGGYSQNGHFNEALNIFQQMQLTGVKPDLDTFASILPACANLAALGHSKEAHESIIRYGFQSDVFVGSALVDTYAKCGSIKNAQKVFDKMPRRSVVSWTAMIVGYAMHGCGKGALQLFEQMKHCGLKPDHVTFIGVLSACRHAGLVDDGWQYFDSMSQDYHITPAVEHYCCMVDLLGCAGLLDEARDFIDKMPIKPDAAVWGSLLSACRIHINIEIGEHAAKHLFDLDPTNPANYLLLSNIYAAAGRWDGIEQVQKRMKDRRVTKKPGCSWIEVNNKVYSFFVGDKSHPQTHKINETLERLSGQMK
eukprot:Gb_24879 [translate_table: standard]